MLVKPVKHLTFKFFPACSDFWLICASCLKFFFFFFFLGGGLLTCENFELTTRKEISSLKVMQVLR